MDADKLPPDVQAALLRGDNLEAMRLLRQRLQDPQDTSTPAARAALERGDHAEMTRLLRETLERSTGRPATQTSREEPLAPGQVAPSRGPTLYGWIVIAVLVVVVVMYLT